MAWSDNFSRIGEFDVYSNMLAIIGRNIPGFKVAYKDKSVSQKIIGFLAFFNRSYMKSCTSVWGNTVYFPSEKFVLENKNRAFKILAHEYVHLLDKNVHPRLFILLYILPQIIGLLSLGALLAIPFGKWFLLFLAFMVFFLPIKAHGRLELEKRGYAMNLAVNMWRYGEVTKDTTDWIVKAISGSTYYWMCRDKKEINDWIEETKRLVRNVDKVKPDRVIFDVSPAFTEVYELVTGIEGGDE